MKVNRFAAAAAALLAVLPARAVELRVEPLPALPAMPVAGAAAAPGAAFAPALTVPALMPVLSAPAATAPIAAMAAVPTAAPEASVAAAAAAEPSAAPAPALVPAARAVAAQAAVGMSADVDASAGRALFDQQVSAPAAEPRIYAPSPADLVRAHAARPLRGAFIQQEQEGSLLSPDARDSSGNIFRYYGPIEMRPELVARVENGLGGFGKAVYATRRFFQFGRGGAEAAWKAWSVSAKLAYLDALETAVVAERGPEAAWNGKVSLILKKTPVAPDYVTAHPHMEPPPDAHRAAVGARYLQPEIVSDKTRPASTVDAALARTRGIIAETGHAGTQYHVFVKADPKILLAQMDRVDGAMQLFNDALFARAAAGSEANLAHASLKPWHRGRSERVRRLLEAANPSAHAPAADDADSEKHAFVGLRWWGMESGKAVISFELRGVTIPWKRAPQRAVSGLESPSAPQRDYDEAREYLTFVSLYAEALARGEAPAVSQKSVVFDEAAADALLASRAKALGMPDGAFDGLAAFARRLTGAATVPQGWLFPFAAAPAGSPRLQALADELVVHAAQAKAAEDAGREVHDAHLRYLTWSAYAAWSRAYADDQDARLLNLVRAAAR
jgi:hypothetical protein